MSPRHPRLPRGMSLIEGMISMAVLAIGILGAFQGILFASQQNSVASRLARASSMAAQVLQGLEQQGFAAVQNIATSASCVSAATAPATLTALTDGIQNTGIPGTCIIDLDLFETTA